MCEIKNIDPLKLKKQDDGCHPAGCVSLFFRQCSRTSFLLFCNMSVTIFRNEEKTVACATIYDMKRLFEPMIHFGIM